MTAYLYHRFTAFLWERYVAAPYRSRSERFWLRAYKRWA